MTISVSVYGSDEELARRYCFKKSTKLTRLQKIFDRSFVNSGRVIFQHKLQKHSGRSGNSMNLIKERWPLSQAINSTSLPLELSHLLTTTAGSSEQVAFISSVTDFIHGPYRQAWYYVREPRFELVGCLTPSCLRVHREGACATDATLSSPNHKPDSMRSEGQG